MTKNWNYLATGATAPLSIPVYEACSKYLDENRDEGFKYYSQVGDIVDEPKVLFGKLVNCEPYELSIIPNSTHGINLVAQMVGALKGDNVVISELEYYGCAYPWLRLANDGVDVRIAKSKQGRVPFENIEKLVDDKTKALSIVHVCHSGFRQDLRRLSKLAHDHGAFMATDAIGTCGVIDVDVKETGVDFLSTSSYKWLLGLSGSGFLYVRKGLIDSLEPPLPGSQATPKINGAMFMDLSPTWEKVPFAKNSARKFETGMPAVLSAISLTASIKLLLSIGMKNVQKRVSDLTQYAIEKMEQIGLDVVTPRERDERGAHLIVAMDEEKKVKADKISSALFKKKIHTQAFFPPYCSSYGSLFVAPDFFNNEEEIDALAREIKILTSR